MKNKNGYNNTDKAVAPIPYNALDLNKAINLLPTEKKEFIVLSKLKELKYKEVAEIMGCTEGTARTKVHRAINDLREIFLTLQNR